MEPITVYIGLGSNLDNPKQQILDAFESLTNRAIADKALLSPLYSSAPVGPPGQPNYVNAAAKIQTHMPPMPLLYALQAIESSQSRVRNQHWGPRTIDLDILLYGDVSICTRQLTVPHNYLPQRNFVLAPLLDLCPTLQIPDGQLIKELFDRIGSKDLERLQ